MLLLLGIFLVACALSNKYVSSSEISDLPACKILSTGKDSCDTADGVCQLSSPRIVVIGDVHGSANGLLEVLYQAEITVDDKSCFWKDQSVEGTILVQIGDIVDRGDQALEAWLCLNSLQSSPPEGSKVVRILGNHELWWLQVK